VLITAAGRRLGRLLALAFSANGYAVAANDLTPARLDETIASIQASGGKGRPYMVDVVKGLPVQDLVDRVLADYQRIDVLVNNAGVQPGAHLLDMDEWDWQRALDVNLSGPFLMMQVVGRQMQRQGGGVVINISGGAWPDKNESDRAAFYATQSALFTLTESAASEFMSYNIRVYGICPGETGALFSNDPAQGRTDHQSPVEKDLTNLAVYLCNPVASNQTGRIYRIDAGQIYFKDGEKWSPFATLSADSGS
jgi:NAD(P)-dependent dehydrogenase (short-subunit alcohol dehydrogenase family)